jgi:hypothetical protein
MKYAALDPADTGADRCAFAGRHGILLEHLESWSGKTSDIFATTARAMNLCDQYGYSSFYYDSDGLGAGCRGDARQINQQRQSASRPTIRDISYRGSEKVYDPNGSLVPGRTNADFFLNMKAMSWYALRTRFERTYKAVVLQLPYFADDLISLDGSLVELPQLMAELSQITFDRNNVGRVVIDKTPDGCASPNLGDAICMAYNPGSRGMESWVRLGLES